MVVSLVSCEKHEILYDTHDLADQSAEFQLHYFEPITNSSANYIDSVFVNGTLYSSVNGSGQLATYNGVPGGATGRFFAVAPGSVKFTFWRGGSVIYDNVATLQKGKQNVYVYDLNEAPIVIQNDYPYASKIIRDPATAATYDTDSIATGKIVNLIFETPGVPCQTKVQCQWRNDEKDADGNWVWHDMGGPIGFGEATPLCGFIVHKTAFNSSGYQTLYWRFLKEDGSTFTYTNAYGNPVAFTDYWSTYIGRSYLYMLAGNRGQKTNRMTMARWTAL
jgi:hypothetical protein